MGLFYGVFFFILGLLIGSFLNVCIYRIPENESIVTPPSHCPKCNYQLKPLDLIPVLSWLFLGGKCRRCKSGISFRYTVVELLTGVIYLALFLVNGLTPTFFASVFLATLLIIITIIDIDHFIIPNGLVLTGIVAGLIVVLANGFFYLKFFIEQTWYEHLLGILPGVISMLLIRILGALIYKQESLGMGDVKLFIPIGVFLGWKLSIAAVLISILYGGIGGTILLLFTKTDRKANMPFGPFIAAGTVTVMLAMEQIISFANWYIGLF